MWERAVVDRIVDGRHAVLLVGEGEIERVVALKRLPQGIAPGAWLRVRFEGEELVEVVVDEAETERVKARLAGKLQALRQRGPKGM